MEERVPRSNEPLSQNVESVNLMPGFKQPPPMGEWVPGENMKTCHKTSFKICRFKSISFSMTIK